MANSGVLALLLIHLKPTAHTAVVAMRTETDFQTGS